MMYGRIHRAYAPISILAAFVRSSELSKAAAVGVQLRTWAERRRGGRAAVVSARAQHAKRRITVKQFTIWLSSINYGTVYLLTFSGSCWWWSSIACLLGIRFSYTIYLRKKSKTIGTQIDLLAWWYRYLLCRIRIIYVF